MGDAAGALARIDLIAGVFVDRVSPAVIRAAQTEAEVSAAQRLRGRALLERGWVTIDELFDGREVSEGDDEATHLLALVEDEPIGTCRLIYSEGDRPLPMEAMETWEPVPHPAVEVGRVVVLAGYGRLVNSMTAALVGKSWLEIRARDYQRICGTASSGMLRLCRRLGFLIEVIGPPALISGEKRFPILFEPNPEAAAVAAAAGGESAQD